MDFRHGSSLTLRRLALGTFRHALSRILILGSRCFEARPIETILNHYLTHVLLTQRGRCHPNGWVVHLSSIVLSAAQSAVARRPL